MVELLSDKTNKYVVHSVVGTELFPTVKFLDCVNDWVYPREKNTICVFFPTRCKLLLEVNEAAFWEKGPKVYCTS